MPMTSVNAAKGPQNMAIVNRSVLKEIAPASKCLGTRFGTIACPAGAQKLRPTPSKAAMKNR
jgi:Fe-S-cluster-containing dehydrogenase component